MNFWLQFLLSFTPWLQPGDRQTLCNPSSRFNGFHPTYERKPLKRFFISKTTASHRAEATV